MTYIPNARTDEEYNEKYLNKEDKAMVQGYDMAMDTIDSFFDNLEIYDFEVDGEDVDLGRFLDNHPEIKDVMRDNLREHLESGRNTLIVSQIDGMNSKDYARNKEMADGGK